MGRRVLTSRFVCFVQALLCDPGCHFPSLDLFSAADSAQPPSSGPVTKGTRPGLAPDLPQSRAMAMLVQATCRKMVRAATLE